MNVLDQHGVETKIETKGKACKASIVEIPDSGCETAARESSETWIKTIFGAKTYIKKDSFSSAAREVATFGVHLFNILDTKKQGYLSIQELVGGFALLRRDKNRRSTNWLKRYFENLCKEENTITFHQFSKALNDDAFVHRLFKLFDLNGDGKILMKEFIAVVDRLACASVDTKWFFWIQENFNIDSKEDRNITLEQFRKALHLKESFFAERFYAILDTNGDGLINLGEIVSGLTMLMQGTEREKLKFLFQVYDIDGNGGLNIAEVRTILESCMEESNIKFDAAQIEELADVFFQEVDEDDDGQITFEEFEIFLNKYPGVAENLNITAGNWLNPTKKKAVKRGKKMIPGKETINYIRKNPSTFFFEILYFLINVGLCVWVGIVRRNDGGWVILARMFGMCLNFNGMLILLLMLKSLLTWLRSTRIGKYVPIDHHIKFHKAVAVIILLQSLLHFVGHLGRYITSDLASEVWECLVTTRTGEGWIIGTAGITGVLLFLVFGIMAVFSLPFVRRQGYFELFYFTHHLYIIWWILLLLHARNFWKWFIAPVMCYLVERITRLSIVNKARYGRTFIKEGITLPSKVTHLIIPRSPNFHYKPGNYVLVNIPEIAKYEWHPFTISSSPEMTDYIWLHIRGVGTWTNKLYDHYIKEKTKEKRNKRQRLSKRRSLRYFRNEERETHQPLRSNSHVLHVAGSSTSQTLTEENKIKNDDDNDLGHTNVVPYMGENGIVVERSGKSFSLQSSSKPCKEARELTSTKQLKIYVDGPYGAPTEHFFEAEHAVLISCGIGVTPFASILQTIILKYREASHTCPNCEHCWLGKIPFSLRKLRKVDFFWINRDQASFEWFLSLLTQLELEQSEQRGVLSEHFLDMHIYMTSALKKEDMKALGLQLALELIHEKKDRDLITGLKTRTKPGRPDWDQVFQDLTGKNHGKISVFYCGNPALGKTLKSFCRKYQCEFRMENF